MARSSEEFDRRLRRLLKFLSDPGNIAGVSTKLLSQRTQYKKRHQNTKRRGGSPPVDFTIVDLKIDLELAIEQEDDLEVVVIYFQLIRIING